MLDCIQAVLYNELKHSEALHVLVNVAEGMHPTVLVFEQLGRLPARGRLSRESAAVARLAKSTASDSACRQGESADPMKTAAESFFLQLKDTA